MNESIAIRSEASNSLPSLGFFGGTWADCLILEFAGKVSSLEVRISGGKEEFLNLRGLSIRGVNQRGFREAGYRVEQSSQRFASQRQPQGPHKPTGIHTLKELRPFWKLTWMVPQALESIRVFNRPDNLGRRARSMRVTVWDEHGESHILFDSGASTFLGETLEVLASLTGRDSAEVVQLATQGEQGRSQIVADTVGVLRSVAPTLSRQECLALFALVPTTRAARSSAEMSSHDWFLLAYLLCGQVHANNASRSGIFAFSELLDSRTRLDSLERQFSAVTSLLGSSPMYIAKHGITPMPFGEAQLQEMHEHANRLIADSAEVESKVSLGYGSLLGAIREGGPIPHDDDFDFFATITAETHRDFVKRREEYMRHLEKSGWIVEPNGSYFNFHVKLPGSAISLDVFAIHVNGDVANGHMERAKWREMPSSWFSSTSLAMFGGARLPVIEGATAFLEERYGKSWRTPDRFHEWRWALND